uniref:uncharacterized protein LOC122595790 n=1 Tax=Erigeron canadensis TaxID=72917 RepID=UPI001CB9B407|nr:uncharacterized protein LOC122595790 [Erigeron canadensis]XP_043624170.1 uncharacterized protein LOC122595790 [Erigeron canadensis]
MTKDSPIYAHAKIPTRGGGYIASGAINGRAILAAQRTRDAGIRKPLANKVLIPLAGPYSRSAVTTGTKAKGKQVSLLKHPRKDLDESSAKSLLNDPIPPADSALEIFTPLTRLALN